MKHLRNLLAVLILFVVTSIVFAGSSWLPLPQVFGPDPGDGSNSWFPTVQVACSQVNISMDAPSFAIMNSYGVDKVEWRFVNLYDLNDSVIATTASAAYGTDPRSIGEWTDGSVKNAVFNITAPIQPGTRAYGVFQYRLWFTGNADYDAWNGQLIQVGDKTHDDFMARAYDATYSIEGTGTNYYEYSCDPAYDLNNAGTNPPTVSLNQNGNPSSVAEGNSGTKTFTYKLDLSAASSRTITAHVVVEGDGGNFAYVSSYPEWDDDNTEGDDFDLKDSGGVLVANTLTYRTEYPFGCGSGATYCDLGIDAQPPFVHEIVFAPGETSKTFTVVVNGETVIEYDQPISIRLNDVSNALFGATTQLTLTIADDDEPYISVANTNVVLNECGLANGASAVYNVPILLDRAAAVNLYLYHFTYPGNATEGTDYAKINSTPSSPPFVSLTLPSGQTLVNVPVTYYGDTAVEYPETFTLELMNAIVGFDRVTPSRTEFWGYSDLPGHLQTSSVNFTIAGNGPNVSIGDASLTEGNSGTTNMQFTVTLAQTATRNTEIYYQTVDGTATAGQDYTGTTSGTATILSGQTTATINIPITGDTNFEANETFTVELTGTDGACIQDGSGTGTINNDDTAPTANIQDASANENAGTMTFTVQLTGTSTQAITMNYATSDGTAIAGTDYVTKSGTLNIPANTSSGSITVSLINNNDYDLSRTFNVTLSNLSNAMAGDLVAVGTINNEDPLPAVTIQDVSAAEATGVLTFTVQLDRKSYQAVTMNYATSDGTAIAGTDYVAKSGSLNIPANTLSTTIPVDLIDDAVINDDLTFNMTLSSLSGATASDLAAVGTILDDDRIANLAIQGDLAEAPLDLIFTWTHQPEPGQTTVPADWYRLWITENAVDVFSKWYQAPTICSGNACAVPFQDFATPYILDNGNYDWVIQGYMDGAITSSQPAQFSINFSTPAQPIISNVDTTYGQPTVTWNPDANASWYLVQIMKPGGGAEVFKKWVTKTSVCTTSCVYATNTVIPEGDYEAFVTGWGPQKFGPQSAAYPFTIIDPTPDLPTGLAVTGQNDGAPDFSWTGSSDASHHHLIITLPGVGKKLDQWYKAGDLGCLGGGTCAVEPPLNLTNNTYNWYVQSWGPSGFNGGSKTNWASSSFLIDAPTPTLVTGIAILNANTGEPTVEWTPDANATWYRVLVSDLSKTTTYHNKWYFGETIGCDGGTCSVKPEGVHLKNGDYLARIQAWGPGGSNNNDKTQWAETGFSVAASAPTAPTLISPIGGAQTNDPTPNFQWNAVPDATWYQIWVEYNGSRIFQKWFTAAALGCDGGGTCIATDSTTSLNPANYAWKVMAYSPAGTGPWSVTESFQVIP